jgi:ankyrin repeat protein
MEKNVTEFLIHSELYEEDEQTNCCLLHKAIDKDYTVDVCKLLLKQLDKDDLTCVDKKGRTILHCAVANQNKAICELILNYIVPNNRQILTIKDNANLNPLMRAAQKGNIDIFKLILDVMTKEEIGIN